MLTSSNVFRAIVVLILLGVTASAPFVIFTNRKTANTRPLREMLDSGRGREKISKDFKGKVIAFPEQKERKQE